MEAAIVSIRCSREGPVDDACCQCAVQRTLLGQQLPAPELFVFLALQERGVARTFNNTDLVLPALKAGVALLDRWGRLSCSQMRPGSKQCGLTATQLNQQHDCSLFGNHGAQAAGLLFSQQPCNITVCTTTTVSSMEQAVACSSWRSFCALYHGWSPPW
jgi:hypothetical protein